VPASSSATRATTTTEAVPRACRWAARCPAAYARVHPRRRVRGSRALLAVEDQVFVDRSTAPIAAALNADGSFSTGPITLNDNQYWYVDRHYVAVNFVNGININTVVYQVAAIAP
jgi:uncharacterized lipoprotein NlpE involved in copper resistance